MLFSSYYSSRIFVNRTNERASLLKTIEVFSTLLNFLLAFKKHLLAILLSQFLQFPNPFFQLSIQLQQSSEYWADKVRELSGQLGKARSTISQSPKPRQCDPAVHLVFVLPSISTSRRCWMFSVLFLYTGIADTIVEKF